jgi:glucokinase
LTPAFDIVATQDPTIRQPKLVHHPLRLLADIGGTNARFALCEGTTVRDELQLSCADYPEMAGAIHHYLLEVGEKHAPVEAAFAIAAPLTGDHISMTNHSWRFAISELRRSLQLRRLIALNDFTALAMSLPHLPHDELLQVGGEAHASNAAIALLGAGTGLGVSGLIHAGEHWLPLQGEGGHVSLAPGNAREAAVLQQLWRSFEHVSVERVLSGPGLVNLYKALAELDGVSQQPYEAADITIRGLGGTCDICAEALQIFCALLGSVAGDLVLTLGATNALYIGGGIVPRLGEYFVQSDFRRRFESKGRYADYLRGVPAYVINSAHPAFIGLAHAFTAPGPRIESRLD